MRIFEDLFFFFENKNNLVFCFFCKVKVRRLFYCFFFSWLYVSVMYDENALGFLSYFYWVFEEWIVIGN